MIDINVYKKLRIGLNKSLYQILRFFYFNKKMSVFYLMLNMSFTIFLTTFEWSNHLINKETVNDKDNNNKRLSLFTFALFKNT